MESSKEDIKTTLELVKRFLPQFTVTREDLLKLNQTFVINFYSHYLKELGNKCQKLLNCQFEDVFSGCPPDLDREMYLLLFIRHILNKIGVPYFTICDFYRPSNRTRTTMKVCTNFLFYTEDILPTSIGIVNAFKNQAEEIELRNDRKLTQKNKLSEITYALGLLKENLEKVKKEYDMEATIQSAPLETDALDKEVEQKEKELEAICNDNNLQEHKLKMINEDIIVLSNEVVPNDYVSCKSTLEQLESTIEDDKSLISKNQKLLEEKHKQCEFINELSRYIQRHTTIDESLLNCVKEISKLKQIVRDMKSQERNITEINKSFTIKNKRIADISKEHQQNLDKSKETLLQTQEKIIMYKKKILAERMVEKELAAQYRELKQKYDISKEENEKIEEQQNDLEMECKQHYKHMLACINLVTSSCKSTLEDMKSYYKE